MHMCIHITSKDSWASIGAVELCSWSKPAVQCYPGCPPSTHSRRKQGRDHGAVPRCLLEQFIASSGLLKVTSSPLGGLNWTESWELSSMFCLVLTKQTSLGIWWKMITAQLLFTSPPEASLCDCDQPDLAARVSGWKIMVSFKSYASQFAIFSPVFYNDDNYTGKKPISPILKPAIFLALGIHPDVYGNETELWSWILYSVHFAAWIYKSRDKSLLISENFNCGNQPWEAELDSQIPLMFKPWNFSDYRGESLSEPSAAQHKLTVQRDNEKQTSGLSNKEDKCQW